MKRILSMIITGMLLLSSCSNIPTDPIKGADKLYKHLEEYSVTNEYSKASKLMEEYLKTYNNEEERTIFFLDLRANLMTPNNKVGDFMLNADQSSYPVFREYMQYIIAIAQAEAMQNKNSYSGTPADEALLFCSLLLDYAEAEDYGNAMDVITKTYHKYSKANPVARTEFFTTFRDFIKNSGEPGQKLFTFITTMPKSTELTDFMRLTLESTVD